GPLEERIARALRYPRERPDVNLEGFGVVQERLARGRRKPQRFEHRRVVRRDFGVAKRPRVVMDAAAVELLPVGRVEAVTLGQEEGEGVGPRLRKRLAES